MMNKKIKSLKLVLPLLALALLSLVPATAKVQKVRQTVDFNGQRTSPKFDKNKTIQEAFEEGDLRLFHSIMEPAASYPNINPDEGGYNYPATGASRATINIKNGHQSGYLTGEAGSARRHKKWLTAY